MALRRLFIGGNWKSNNTIAQTKDLVDKVVNKLTFDTKKTEVVVSPIFTQIPLVQSLIKNQVQVAAQNCSATSYGQYTGEIAPEHLVDLGLKWVILGHSERRQFYGETNDLVGQKVHLALDKGLQVIACVGEKLEDREKNQTTNVIDAQLNAIKAKLQRDQWARVVIAYEPVWAIGTGKVASPEQAQEVHLHIRRWLEAQLAREIANNTRIIYGGSVNEKNSNDLIKQTDIDGFLVGGASLKSGFIDIVNSAATKN
jgi:triosephosphate isomerase